jgi:hypothetical protein
MHRRTGLLSLICLLVSGTAHAVSVTNRDDKDHKLTIVEGDSRQEKVLKPTEAIADVCPKGCVIRLGDSENDEYELEGTEVVSIEDGYLYYDGPDVGSETAPGSTTQPPPSSKPTPAPPSK